MELFDGREVPSQESLSLGPYSVVLQKAELFGAERELESGQKLLLLWVIGKGLTRVIFGSQVSELGLDWPVFVARGSDWEVPREVGLLVHRSNFANEVGLNLCKYYSLHPLVSIGITNEVCNLRFRLHLQVIVDQLWEHSPLSTPGVDQVIPDQHLLVSFGNFPLDLTLQVCFAEHSENRVNVWAFQVVGLQQFLKNFLNWKRNGAELDGPQVHLVAQMIDAFDDEGRASEKHFIEENSERPNVCLVGVKAFEDDFGRHIF